MAGWLGPPLREVEPVPGVAREAQRTSDRNQTKPGALQAAASSPMLAGRILDRGLKALPMPTARCLFALLWVAGTIGAAGLAVAQPAPGDSQRDCQTIRTCNFARGGLYRGCLSSYSCRVCRMVTTSCRVGGGPRRVCQELRCNWG